MTTPLPPVRRVARLALSLLVVVGLVVAACAAWVALAPSVREPSAEMRGAAALAGRTIVLDAGHQLGNGRFVDEIAHSVPAGKGRTKACNTTGTASDAGYPEATFAFEVTEELAARLRTLGAAVVLTRTRNETGLWGPCVDERGRAGNTLHGGGRADLKLSVHGDGCRGCGPGFHVLVAGPDHPVGEASHAFAGELRSALLAAGLERAAYTGEGEGLVERDDLATLNLSRMPAAMVELGNMRDPADAAWMQDGRGRARIAEALAAAVVAYLG